MARVDSSKHRGKIYLDIVIILELGYFLVIKIIVGLGKILNRFLWDFNAIIKFLMLEIWNFAAWLVLFLG
jgi:hypothetical protein